MRFNFLLLLVSLMLVSCDTDVSSRNVYLAAKFKLKYAAVIPGYKIDITPYFYTLPNRTNYLSYFDINNSIFNIETKIDSNGNPYGVGSINIVFKDSTLTALYSSYNYYCSYDGVYGGNIIMDKNAKPSFLGDASYRMRYWWVRMEAWLPQVVDERLILEFQYYEMNDEPTEFDNHKIW